MKQKQTIGYKEVTFRGIERNYIICDIRVHPASTQLVKDNKGNTIKQRLTGLLVGKKVKFDESNLKLLEKLKKLRKRTKITVIYNRGIATEDLRNVTVIDITTEAELKEKISYLFDTNNMLSSTTEKTKYKTYTQRGTNIIKKHSIKGLSNSTNKYYIQQDLFGNTIFTTNEFTEEITDTRQIFPTKNNYIELNIDKLIELLEQEEAKGRKTYVVVKTKVQ